MRFCDWDGAALGAAGGSEGAGGCVDAGDGGGSGVYALDGGAEGASRCEGCREVGSGGTMLDARVLGTPPPPPLSTSLVRSGCMDGAVDAASGAAGSDHSWAWLLRLGLDNWLWWLRGVEAATAGAGTAWGWLCKEERTEAVTVLPAGGRLLPGPGGGAAEVPLRGTDTERWLVTEAGALV